jgi:hypothetical protein
MPFKSGHSGNPGGRKRSLGLSRAVRRSEGLKSWAKLLALRDERIKEQTVIKENGESVVIEVVSFSQRATRSLQADSCLLLGHSCCGWCG